MCGLVMSFAFIWKLWWLVLLGLVGLIIAIAARANERHTERTIPASELAKLEAGQA